MGDLPGITKVRMDLRDGGSGWDLPGNVGVVRQGEVLVLQGDAALLAVVVEDPADGQQQPDAAVVPAAVQTLHLHIDRWKIERLIDLTNRRRLIFFFFGAAPINLEEQILVPPL